MSGPDCRHLSAVVSGQEVRAALSRDEFVLHYQPVVDLATGRVHGVEALLRWQHPRGGLLPPADFLPAVVQTPVMDEVTGWLLGRACRQAGRWPHWYVAVNISARDLARAGFVEEVRDALAQAALAPSRLLLELTETALVQDLPAAVRALSELRRTGVRLALDDFGTGYSSMLYLRELPVTDIKIDRTFVGGLGKNGEDTAIVTSVLHLARAVDLVVTAEGVETAAQRDRLFALGCPLGQGYLFSTPQPPEALGQTGQYAPARTAPARRVRPAADTASPVALHRMQELLTEGASLHTIASALNREGLRTPRGVRWHPSSVAQALENTAGAGSDPR